MLDKGSTMFIVVYCKHAVLAWANVNNLRLNLAKCAEIIFYDSRRKRQPVQPSPLPNVPRVQSLKILGVTISSKLSVAEHAT